jgi:class 3 adenylate cyclase
VERGAEQLVDHLNIYFDRIIALIQQWGGDIVKFAGDAMLCVFYADAPDYDKEKMRGVSISLVTFTLSIVMSILIVSQAITWACATI